MKFNQLTKSISLALLASSTAQSAEFIVTSAGDAGGDLPIEIATDVFEINTLRSAIQQADNESAFPGADVIRFDPSIFVQGQASIELNAVGDSFSFGGTSNSAFGINSDITVESSTDSELTLTAGNLRHFQVNSGGTLRINHITLEGGSTPNNLSGRGGAVYVRTGANFHIANSTISNNSANTGGGINIRDNGSPVTIVNTVFMNNVSTGSSGSGTGGAVFKKGEVPLIVSQSDFYQNTSNYAGGALFISGRMIVEDSTIHGNTSNRDGGGISGNNQGVLTLLNSTISNNQARFDGGGVELNTELGEGMNTIVNSTIANNQSYSNTSLESFARNTQRGGEINLDSSGGGLFVGDYEATIELHNTLIVNNVETTDRIPDDIAAAPSLDSSHNLFGVGDSVIGLIDGVNGNQIGTLLNPIDAELLPLADNGGPTLTHRLSRSSPAIDSGSNTEATEQNLSADQRGIGFTRFVSTVDIGAVETDLIFADGFDSGLNLEGSVE
ncbi:choice-of-anchor Q domain-containing protein [Marinicella sp. W31]|uniref:choice-of-anchor Q domain-containing protein n=1 Tax=Marinicella sp. W31 TaxID=3023713 RepID=UPI0037569CF7